LTNPSLLLGLGARALPSAQTQNAEILRLPLSVKQFGFAAIPPRLSGAALAERATDRCRGEAEGGEEEDDGQHDAPGLPGEVGEYQVANSGQCVEKRL